MNENFNIQIVLIAPLDWGLGHATRCIPIIKALQNNYYRVIVAANEKQKVLLNQELNNVEFVELEGYNIQYSKQKWKMPFKILAQIPQILQAIKKENKWVHNFCSKQKVDLIISDNRYGFYHKKTPSVFITHQLNILTPFIWLSWLVRKINISFIKKFNACWIADIEGKNNIAGKLSFIQNNSSIAFHYLGILSRFKKHDEVEKKYDYCFLISGPEPQRTMLENIILNDVERLNGNVVLLRGLPNNTESVKSNSNNIVIYNHLSGVELQKIIQESEYIISRSGYTTIMELLSLQKKSILIPTPGQTEQEYLAQHLMEQGFCYSVEQQNFKLLHSINAAKKFKYHFANISNNNLNKLLPQLIAKIKK